MIVSAAETVVCQSEPDVTTKRSVITTCTVTNIGVSEPAGIMAGQHEELGYGKIDLKILYVLFAIVGKLFTSLNISLTKEMTSVISARPTSTLPTSAVPLTTHIMEEKPKLVLPWPTGYRELWCYPMQQVSFLLKFLILMNGSSKQLPLAATGVAR
ncbi:hypothetical protein RRG08_034588 [Elysia crispata]|uniref:Uncharacterized protein n=1 Tax=Elysia crispata TaxID=231223 RepID=A0AAE1B3Q0_9GAST|nr:hypothetical protein RRG08_034588 [Elysia crispata]